MYVVIAGGGDITLKISKKLINEGHNITIIEKNENLIRILQSALDAIIIHGDATDRKYLIEAEIEKASLFIGVAGDDMVNLISCKMVRTLNENDMTVVGKIDNSFKYFDEDKITETAFGINLLIKPMELSVSKILQLIEMPEIFEITNYEENKAQLVGITISENFVHCGMQLKDIAQKDYSLGKLMVIAIQRGDEVIIPMGDNRIVAGDKLYIIGKTEFIQEFIDTHFKLKSNIKDIVVIGANKITTVLASEIIKRGYKLTVIEKNRGKCEKLAKLLDNNTLILNGATSDSTLLNEINIKKSCVISLTNDDEYNIISSFTMKQNSALKTICMIKESSLVEVIRNLGSIDSVFSPHNLSVVEILKKTRKTKLFSISSFSQINAEIVGIEVNQNVPILNKKLKDVKIPKGATIGIIIRGNEIIIPKGNDEIKLNDKIVLFVLPEAINEIEKIFSHKHRRG